MPSPKHRTDVLGHPNTAFAESFSPSQMQAGFEGSLVWLLCTAVRSASRKESAISLGHDGLGHGAILLCHCWSGLTAEICSSMRDAGNPRLGNVKGV